MGQTSRHTALGIMALVAGIAVIGGDAAWRAARAQDVDANLVAQDIPGASAIAQVGKFLNEPTACANPIPTKFSSFIQQGAVLDPDRILVGSRSNFGAPLAMGVGQEGSFLSINPGPGNLSIQPDFAQHDGQASTLGGDVQMFSANSPKFLNGAGKLRALAVTIERRLDAFPDIPAVAEFVPGYEASNWYGVGAPRNTEIVEKLNKEINAGLADPKLRARLADLGGTVLAGLPSDFAKLIADETEKWGKMIRALNIKAD